MRYLDSRSYEVASAVACETRYPSYLRLVTEPHDAIKDTPEIMCDLRYRCRRGSMHSFVVSMIYGICLITLFIAVVFINDSFTANKRAEAAARVSYVQIIVSQGDSLWNIASEHSVQGLATTDTVELIEEHNGLDGALLMAGQRLWVPIS